jgi:hypothetical protein
MQKKHLSRLVEKAARGESFIIAKAGKPMVQDSHFGFMDGLYEPDDFKTMGAAEIKREVCGDK